MRYAYLMMVLLLATPVLAQEPPATPPNFPKTTVPLRPQRPQVRPPQPNQQPGQENPCVRGPTQVTIAGMDQDLTRCQEAMTDIVIDNLTEENKARLKAAAKQQAELLLTRSDWQNAQAQLAQVSAELAWYKSYYDGVEPELEKKVAPAPTEPAKQ